jgi:pyruvate,orthophosphate dikinase
MMQWVHNVPDIDPTNTARYGGKGAGLARMTALGLPVPPAFVIDTAACRVFGDLGGRLPEGLGAQVGAGIAGLETATGRTFAGVGGVPLLISVRSGAKVSMPGMMDTVLNLGLDRGNIERFAAAVSAPVAVDCWLRFWAMYSDIVLDVDPELLRESVEAERVATSAALDAESAMVFENAVLKFLGNEGVVTSANPRAQLDGAIAAVFRSWNSRRAKTYRAHHGIPDDLGTAVVVQAMVFGNAGVDSGSGVAFTRDPKTGEAALYGEYLPQGQGEEVVAGTRTPVDLAEPKPEWVVLRTALSSYARALEREYRDALDIEFTVENTKLYLLQVRPAKRTAGAAVRIATEMLAEGAIDEATALARVSVEQVRRLISPQFSAEAVAGAKVLITGIAASPGHGSGAAVLDADRAAALAAEGADVVLVRPTTSPQDLRGMLAATAVVTARGGATSHAAVVSRALDKPCVVGAAAIDVRPDEKIFVINGTEYAEGTQLSVDGGTGQVFAGLLPRGVPDGSGGVLEKLLSVADRRSAAGVWLPLCVPAAVAAAAGRGIRGIGVVGLTDLLTARSGAVGRMVESIEVLSTDPNATAGRIEDTITGDVHSVVRTLLENSRGLPLDLRLPVLTSPRARRLIREWTSLAPHLLLPLGPRRLLSAWLAGIAAAVEDTGHPSTTVLLGGVSNVGEIDAFAEMAGEVGLRSGAVLGNPTVLFESDLTSRQDRVLWVDLHELTRTAHGYPEELLFTISEFTAGGALGETTPGSSLNPLVRHLLAKLVGPRKGPRIGVDLAGAAPTGVAPDLYRMGFRTFTATGSGIEELRLLLGQVAAVPEEIDHG